MDSKIRHKTLVFLPYIHVLANRHFEDNFPRAELCGNLITYSSLRRQTCLLGNKTLLAASSRPGQAKEERCRKLKALKIIKEIRIWEAAKKLPNV